MRPGIIAAGAAVSNAPFAQINGPSDGPRAPYYNGNSADAAADDPTIVADTPFTVTVLGSDSSGNDTTYDLTNYVRARMRQPAPNDASLTPRTLAIAWDVHQGSVISGVTNNSTLPYPKVMARWDMPPGRLIGSTPIRIGVVAFQQYGMFGKPVACVKITGTPTTGSAVTKTCTYGAPNEYGDTAADDWSSMWSSSDFPSNGNAKVTFTFEAIGWVGRTTSRRLTTGTWPDITQCTPQIYYTGTPTIGYAYVDGTGAGTPQASTNQTTAKNNPFATIDAAANALVTLRSGDLSFSNIYLKSVATGGATGSYTWSNTAWSGATRQALNGWLSIEGDPDDSNPYANVTLTTSGTNKINFTNSSGTYSYLRFANLALTIAASSNLGNYGGKSTLWMDHVNYSSALGGSATWASVPVSYATNCDVTSTGSLGFGLSAANMRFELIRNCRSDKYFAANLLMSNTSSVTGQLLGEASNLSSTNVIAYNNKHYNVSTNGNLYALPTVGGLTGTTTDVAVVQVDATGPSNTNLLFITLNDQQRQTTTNLLIIACTACPALGTSNFDSLRMNFLEDTPIGSTTLVSSAIPVSISNSVQCCNFGRIACKGDRFSYNNGGDTGAPFLQGHFAWEYRNNSWDCVSEWTTDDNFKPTLVGYNSIEKSKITYVDRATDRHPVSGHRLIPYSRMPLSRDITGAVRTTSGSGTASGAYEAA